MCYGCSGHQFEVASTLTGMSLGGRKEFGVNVCRHRKTTKNCDNNQKDLSLPAVPMYHLTLFVLTEMYRSGFLRISLHH